MKVMTGDYSPESLGLEGWTETRGIFVGGCVERGVGSSFRRRAHAHNYERDDEWFGYICVRSTGRVLTDSGSATTLLIHERAHLLTPNQGHTEKWAKALSDLGRPAEARQVRARYARRG